MKDLEQAAIFRNWVQEIEKNPFYLDELKPNGNEVDDFLKYLNVLTSINEKGLLNTQMPLELFIHFSFYFGSAETLKKVKSVTINWIERYKEKMNQFADDVRNGKIELFKIPRLHTKTPPQEPVKTPPQERTNKQINITDAQFIEDLHTALKMYFDESEHDKLMELLEGQSIEGKVKFNGKVVLFGELFKRIRLQGKVTDTKGKLAEWVVSNFQFIINGNHKDTSQSTIDNYLSKASSHTPIKVEGLE